MTVIIRMNRFGRIWRIQLECGHTIERTPQEVKDQQLYIDKRIGCEQCAQAAAEMEEEEGPGECLTCGTQCDQEGICPLCAALERAQEDAREGVPGVAVDTILAAGIESCRKCGAALTLRDVVEGDACTDQGEGEEAGNVFVYCSAHCRETH